MKKLIALFIVVLVLATGLAVGSHFLIDRSSLKQQVIAAVQRQTGRELTMTRFSVSVLPWPSFSARNVVLHGRSGTADQPTIEARDIRASIALLPLLWREIRLESLTLAQGKVFLSRDSHGVANWEFKPAPSPVSTVKAQVSHPAAHWGLQIGSARLDRMSFVLDDRYAQRSGEVEIDHAEFQGLASSTPYLDIHGQRNAVPFRLNGHVGPLTLLQGANPPWSLSLGATLGKEGKQQDWLNFDGQITDTRHLRGFSGVLRGEISALKDIETVFPNANLPDFKGLGGEVGLYDADPEAGSPKFNLARVGVNHLHAHLDAAPSWHGVSVSALHADADTLSSALTVTARAEGRLPALSVQGTFGTLAQAGTAWQSGLTTPLTVALDLRDAAQLGAGSGGRWHVSGQIGATQTALSFDGKAQTLPLLQTALHDVTLKGSLQSDSSGGFQIEALSLTSVEASAVLEAKAQGIPTPSINGKLHFDHLDLDALNALWLGPKTPEKARQNTDGGASIVTNPVAALTAPQAPAEAGSSANGTGVVQTASTTENAPGWDAFLTKGHGALDVTADKVRFNAADYTGVSAQASLESARLVLDAVHGSGDGMTLSGRAVYDMGVRPASLKVSLTPLLVPATLAQNLLAMPDIFRGPVMLVGDLEAQGESRSALLASLDGHLGLSMVGGTISGKRLGPYLGDAARTLISHGDLPVRCLGLHAAFKAGQASFDTIGVEAGPLSLSGHGVYELSGQTLDLHLLPRVGFGGAGASTPVVVSGTVDAPKVQQEAGADGRFALSIGGDSPDTCPDLLSAARENVAGEAAPERKKRSQASELLRGLGILH
ncbi:AsmA family protein [Asaia astilbis]